MIETEKATDRMDLPHAYDQVSRDDKVCTCSRPKAHHLHDSKPITEQASHTAMLQTEKGS